MFFQVEEDKPKKEEEEDDDEFARDVTKTNRYQVYDGNEEEEIDLTAHESIKITLNENQQEDEV